MRSGQLTWLDIEGDTGGKRDYEPPFMEPGWLTVFTLAFFTSCAGVFQPRLDLGAFNQAHLNQIISIA